jgi:hypothetical protein
MIHAAFIAIKSSSLGFMTNLDIIVILKSLWLVTKISFHTWSGLIADFQNLPRTINLGIYGVQIESTKSSDQERHTAIGQPIEDSQV